MHHLLSLGLNWIMHFGYVGIFISMALEGSFAPIPSEVVLPFSGYLVSIHHLNYWMVVLVATVANSFGASLLYAVGLWGGKPFVYSFGQYFFFSHKRFEQSEKWFDKYGDAAVFIARIMPLVRTVVSLPAGIFEMRFSKFLTYTTLGSFIWAMVLVYIGKALGHNWRSVEAYSKPFSIVVGILLIVFCGFVYYRRSKHQSR